MKTLWSGLVIYSFLPGVFCLLVPAATAESVSQTDRYQEAYRTASEQLRQKVYASRIGDASPLNALLDGNESLKEQVDRILDVPLVGNEVLESVGKAYVHLEVPVESFPEQVRGYLVQYGSYVRAEGTAHRGNDMTTAVGKLGDTSWENMSVQAKGMGAAPEISAESDRERLGRSAAKAEGMRNLAKELERIEVGENFMLRDWAHQDERVRGGLQSYLENHYIETGYRLVSDTTWECSVELPLEGLPELLQKWERLGAMPSEGERRLDAGKLAARREVQRKAFEALALYFLELAYQPEVKVRELLARDTRLKEAFHASLQKARVVREEALPNGDYQMAVEFETRHLPSMLVECAGQYWGNRVTVIARRQAGD